MTQLSKKEIKDIMITLSEYDCALQECTEYNDNKQIVMEIVNFDGKQLEYASDRLKNDMEVVLVAIENSLGAYCYVSKEIKDSKEKILEIMKKRAVPLMWLNPYLQEDEDIILALIKRKSPFALFENLNDKFKNNKNIAIAAIESNGLNTQHVLSSLLDEKMALSAVRQNGKAIIYIPKEINNYDNIVFEAIKNDGYCLEHLDCKYKDNKELVLIAVSNSEALQHASERLRNDKEVVLKAIDFMFSAYEHASETLKHDKEVILLALIKDSEELGDLDVPSVYFNIPQSIKLEIGDNDPIQYLKSAILKDTIDTIIEDIPTPVLTAKKIKI